MKAQYGILRFKKYKGPAISPIEATMSAPRSSTPATRISTRTGATTTSIWCSRRADTGKKPTA